jgi:RNA polymerase sigma-70 factor (ECF subfamily)
VGSYGWDERELVRRCKEGSEAAYAELVRQHRQRLVNLAYRLTGNRETAEDVVQETFLAAFRAMERFEPKPAVAPWLNTIAVRLAGRASARRASAGTSSLDGMLDPDGNGGSGAGALELPALAAAFGTPGGMDPAAAAEAAELRRELSAGIADLPFKHRAAVVLRFVVGLEYAEAAQAMDVPLNTYKSLLLRGTRQLRERLGARLSPPDGEARIEVRVGSGPGTRRADASLEGADGHDVPRRSQPGRRGGEASAAAADTSVPVSLPVERRAVERPSGSTQAMLTEEPGPR